MWVLLVASQLALAQVGVPILRVSAERLSPCADSSAFTEAIHTRAPGVVVGTPGAAGADDLQLVLVAEPRAWRLEVRRADGAVALSRSIESIGKSCVQLADIAALVLDRFLQQVEWRGRTERIEPLPQRQPPELAMTPPPPPLIRGGSASFGLSGRTGSPAQLGLSLDAGLRLPASLRASLWLHGREANETKVVIEGVERGRFRSQVFTGALTFSFCRGEGLALCSGILAGAELAVADASGPFLYRPSPQSAWLPVAGLYGRVSYPIVWRLEAAADIAAFALLGAARLEVEGAGVGYSPPKVSAVASVRLGWSFF